MTPASGSAALVPESSEPLSGPFMGLLNAGGSGGLSLCLCPPEESLPRPDSLCTRVSVTEFPPSQGEAGSQLAAQGPGAQSPLQVGLEEGMGLGAEVAAPTVGLWGLGALSSVPVGQVGTHRWGLTEGLGKGEAIGPAERGMVTEKDNLPQRDGAPTPEVSPQRIQKLQPLQLLLDPEPLGTYSVGPRPKEPAQPGPCHSLCSVSYCCPENHPNRSGLNNDFLLLRGSLLGLSPGCMGLAVNWGGAGAGTARMAGLSPPACRLWMMFGAGI